jgi:catechol 2,3-dioxygenase-like lactoylglutathione lyase family enzyme
MPITRGVHHIGLTVARLQDSADFFTGLLGWQEVRRDDSYPAIFVSDGHILITLWQAQQPAMSFNKNTQVGLHHLALQVNDSQALDQLYDHLLQHNITFEFAPELLRDGPARHMMCYEPGGIRIEFIWPGQ